MVIMFSVKGQAAEAMIWPIIRRGNEGSGTWTAIHRIQQPAVLSIPAKSNYREIVD